MRSGLHVDRSRHWSAWIWNPRAPPNAPLVLSRGSSVEPRMQRLVCRWRVSRLFGRIWASPCQESKKVSRSSTWLGADHGAPRMRTVPRSWARPKPSSLIVPEPDLCPGASEPLIALSDQRPPLTTRSPPNDAPPLPHRPTVTLRATTHGVVLTSSQSGPQPDWAALELAGFGPGHPTSGLCQIRGLPLDWVGYPGPLLLG